MLAVVFEADEAVAAAEVEAALYIVVGATTVEDWVMLSVVVAAAVVAAEVGAGADSVADGAAVDAAPGMLKLTPAWAQRPEAALIVC